MISFATPSQQNPDQDKSPARGMGQWLKGGGEMQIKAQRCRSLFVAAMVRFQLRSDPLARQAIEVSINNYQSEEFTLA